MTDYSVEQAEGEIKYITKKCNRCNELKPVEEFHKNSASHDGRRTICKECHNTARRVVGESGTVYQEHDQGPGFLSGEEMVNTSETVPGGSGTDVPTVPGGFGTPLVLVLPEDEGGSNLMMEKTSMCPGCCRYNVLWLRHLIAPGVLIPIGVCNDCLLQVDSELVNFYEGDGILYIVRDTQTAHLSNLM